MREENGGQVAGNRTRLPLITIDIPDSAWRVARKVRAANPAQRGVHYVAPLRLGVAA